MRNLSPPGFMKYIIVQPSLPFLLKKFFWMVKNDEWKIYFNNTLVTMAFGFDRLRAIFISEIL